MSKGNKCEERLDIPYYCSTFVCMKSKGHEGNHVYTGYSIDQDKAFNVEWQ